MSPKLCYCCSNKRGSQIVGIFDLVMGFTFVVIGFLHLRRAAEIDDEQKKLNNDRIISSENRRKYDGNFGDQMHEDEDDLESAMNEMYTTAAVELIGGGLRILLGCILLCAIWRESMCCLQAWIIPKITIFILQTLSIVYQMCNNTFRGTILGITLDLTIGLWIISVVYCHRQDIKEERTANEGIVFQA